MSIDLSSITEIRDKIGVVTKITDASGRVLWKLQSGGKVILEVEKITSDTYAGETTYTGEQFILLDIYPKTNGTVKVTYGGLTKTITDTSGVAEPNAQKVSFGTFNGVPDEVETPASGELVIEGQYSEFATGTYEKYTTSKAMSYRCGCITAVKEWGNITDNIPSNAFSNCDKLTSIQLPSSLTSIGSAAFYYCRNLSSIQLPSSLTSIGNSAFYSCDELTSIQLPSSLNSIGDSAFYDCYKLKSVTFENTSGWYTTKTAGGDISTGTAIDVSDAAANATKLCGVTTVYWYRS